jgi:hypothetical protein
MSPCLIPTKRKIKCQRYQGLKSRRDPPGIDATLLVPLANQHSPPTTLTAEIEFGELPLSNINPTIVPVARTCTCKILKMLPNTQT